LNYLNSKTIFFIFIIIFTAGCAASSSTTKSSSEPTKPAATALSMPSGWDDSIIDRIKEGKGLKKRVAVLEFSGNSDLEGKVDLKLSDMLITSLVKSGKFDVIERTQIEKVLNEQKLGMSGIIDESTAAEVGKLLGAEYVIFGVVTSATQQNIDKFAYTLVVVETSIDVRVVDAVTGKIIVAERATGKSESKIVKTSDGTVVSGAVDFDSEYSTSAQKAIDKIGDKIGTLFPLLGYVVQVEGMKVTLDIGEERGASSGDSFIVIRVTDELLHPVTGKRIGWNKEVLATITINTTEKTLSIGTIVKKKSSETIIKPGDLIISVNR